jgi:hypothetical protein
MQDTGTIPASLITGAVELMAPETLHARVHSLLASVDKQRTFEFGWLCSEFLATKTKPFQGHYPTGLVTYLEATPSGTQLSFSVDSCAACIKLSDDDVTSMEALGYPDNLKFVKFVETMLALNPADRPTFDEVLATFASFNPDVGSHQDAARQPCYYYF